MRTTFKHVRIDCDICHERDISEPDDVVIDGVFYDVCYDCLRHFNAVMDFLTMRLGKEITFKISDKR